MLKIHFFPPIRKDWSEIQINSFQMRNRTKKKWQRWYETILGPWKQISLFGIKEMELKRKKKKRKRITLLQNLSPPRFGIFSIITLNFLFVYLFCPLCLIPCDAVHWSRPGFPVLHHLLEFARIHVHSVVMLSNHLILCLPLLLLPSIFPRSIYLQLPKVFTLY